MSYEGTVQIGSRVRVREVDGDMEFTLVSPEDADLATKQFSAASPMGRALMGRRPGDEVRFHTPGGTVSITLMAIWS